MNEYKIYTYIYGELDDDDNIVYVGKSNDPRQRNRNKPWVKRFKILDKFIDPEQRWIHELSTGGCTLKNNVVIKTCGDFVVGDIYSVLIGYVEGWRGVNMRISVKHIPTQRIFESKCAASKFFGKERSWCTGQMRRGNTDWEIISHP